MQRLWLSLRSVAWLVGLVLLFVLWIYLERPPEQPPNTTLLRVVVFSGERDQVFWRLIKKGFQEKNPDIHLQFIKAAEGDKVGTMIAGGDAPDIVNPGAGEQFWYYTDANVLRDLTPYLTEEDKKDLENDFFPVARESMIKDGKYYALPWNLIPFILFYNKTLFERYNVPFPDETWTWDDYESAAKKLTKDVDGDGFPDIFGANFAQWQDGYYNWFYQNGGSVIGPDGKSITFNTPEIVEAIRFIHKLSRVDNVMANQKNQPKNVGGSLFAANRQAMIGPTGSFYIPQFRGEDYRQLDWDIAPLPMGRTGKRAAVAATSGWGVTVQSKHPEEAFRLVKYLCGPEGQAALAESALFVPARRSVATNMDLMNPTGKPEHMRSVIHAVENDYAFVPPYTGRKWGEFQQYLNEKLNDFVFGVPDEGDTPETVAKAIQARGDQLLAEERLQRAGTPLPVGTLKTIGTVLALLVLALWANRVRLEAKRSRHRAREQWIGYAAIAPWLVGFLVFAAGPILFSVLLSLCRWNNLAPPAQARFIGLDNYQYLMSGSDEYFVKSLWVTAKYTFWAVPLGLVAGLILALFMNSKIRGINVYRTVYYLPAVLPGIATTMLWFLMFKQNGILNYLLGGWTGIDYHTMPDWLGDPVWTIPAILVMGLWGVGGGMMIYLAGLQNIPTELYNAAEVDGAGIWSKFRHVTLPMLSPVLFFNLVMGIIGTFQVFGSAFVLFGTGGGPKQSALFYGLYLYRKAFELFDIGMGAALAWILFVIILAFTMLIFKSSSMWVYYEGTKEGKA